MAPFCSMQRRIASAFRAEFFCGRQGLEGEDEVLEAVVEILGGDYELEGLA
jgi:hypothetical protein